jgi:hypothetical protein
VKQQSTKLEWSILLVVPALSVIVGATALPAPKPTEESRQQVDRQSLARDVTRTAPTFSEPLGVELGGGRLRVVGADLPRAEVARGKSATIATTFEVLKELDRDWKFFLHVDMRGGRHRVHGDHWPLAGRYPTSSWLPGEFVTDRHELSVPLDTPPGEYEAFLGLYIGDERMPVTGGTRHDGENRVRLGRFTVH